MLREGRLFCAQSVPAMTFTKEECEEWRRNPLFNPRTHRVIGKVGKVFAQIQKVCGDPAKPAPPMPTPHHTKLVTAIRKVGLARPEHLEARIGIARALVAYLRNASPCLRGCDRKLCLVSGRSAPLVRFEKRIGTESAYGAAYVTTGASLPGLLHFSAKVMSADEPSRSNEVRILEAMSRMVERQQCPNMPLIYGTLRCSAACEVPQCPDVVRISNAYYVVLNELADCDLETWLKKKHSVAKYGSMLVQMMFALYCFHRLGQSHNDCHLGNFLMHRTSPGGYWWYRVGGLDVYVPNHGWLLVLWDPGIASQLVDFKEDYVTLLAWLLRGGNGLRPLPQHMVDNVLKPIALTISESQMTETRTLQVILRSIQAACPSLAVGGKPPGTLLNVKAFTMSPK